MNQEPVTACPVLTDTQAKLEASRCLMCDDPPCVAACPASVPVKHFIRAIRFDSPRRAINLIREQNILAGICGLACPVDQLCVGACSNTELSMPIAINKLQHYAARSALDNPRRPASTPTAGRRVAVIGAGPSGLAVAAELARRGHVPTILEKNPLPGGICTYGVPSHRMPQNLVAGEIEYVKSLGVEIKTSTPFGTRDTLDDLFGAGYDAVYVACGVQQAAIPKLPGADKTGVYTWKQILDACSAADLGQGEPPTVANSVIIVGGGSVAMDVATRVSELGAEEIDIVCLESPREMPAAQDELHEVWQSGARFHTRSLPVEVTAEYRHVNGLKAARIRWKEPNLFVPSNAEIIPGTEYWLPAEMIVFAIGARPSRNLARALVGVDLDESGRIVIEADTGATSRTGVYAGGDVAVAGGATIVKAVAEGQRAAIAIDDYLRGLAQ